jgi:predicted dehydrogenase
MFKLAVIGCGRMGVSGSDSVRLFSPTFWDPISHLDAARSLSNVNPVAICDVDETLLNLHLATNKDLKTFTDYDVMFRECQIDILCVATRTPAKTKIIEAAAAAGIKHLHVEKPLCNTSTELKKIKALIVKHDLKLTYGCIRRHLPYYAKLKEIINKSGKKLLDIHVQMGALPAMWSLVHALDLILFYADSPVSEVQAVFDHFDFVDLKDRTIRNDPRLLSGTIYFEDGKVGRVGSTLGDGIILSSVDGQVELLNDGREILIRSRKGSDPYLTNVQNLNVDDYEGPTGSAAAIAHLAAAASGDQSSMPIIENTMEDMLLGMEVLFAMIDSHLSSGSKQRLSRKRKPVVLWGITEGRYA